MFEGVALETSLNLAQAKTGEPTLDTELVQAVLAGDDAAFGLLFERYRRLVVHLVSRFFNSRELIEELTQQAFTKIYFSLENFRGEGEKSFQSWLSRLTINVCYDELRRRQRRPESLFTDLSNDDAEYVESIIGGESLNSEQSFINKDLAEKLLSGLDAKDRLALTLFYAEELSVSEVAEKVGWTNSNVKVRLMRTRKYLRNLLDKLI